MALSGNSVDVDLSIMKNEVSLSQNKRIKNQQCSGLLRKLVCSHQGSIIEHIYWGAELHKEMRIALTNDNIEKVRSKLNEIDNDLPEIFRSSWRLTVNILNGYFSSSHKNSFIPRMCIKATTTTNNTKYTVDVFREDGCKSNLRYKVPDNKGFSSVEKDGRYYHCENIPNAIKKGEYFNPRLNIPLAKKYKKNVFSSLLNKFDSNWAECWSDYAKEKGNEIACYKSTLIIPITLMNNPQSDKFIKGTAVGGSKDARSIYGFLCFDHVETDYFTEDDVNIGYIIADLLSYYMINELNFTTNSNIYREAKNAIKN
jgi:hypothetical protein